MPELNSTSGAESEDFISQFLAFTDGMVSPPIFRLWAGIALMAGALERRVWLRAGKFTTFPSLYTLLVAPPGVGKQIIDVVRDLWTETTEPGSKIPAFHVAPDSVTKASLVDSIAGAKTSMLTPQGPMYTYQSLLVGAEEISVLIPAYDMEFIGVLNALYNNKSSYKERRRTGTVRELAIENPVLNMLCGAQPSYLAHTLPEEVWNSGISRRMLMVYCGEVPIHNIFEVPEDDADMRLGILQRLSRARSLYGQMRWEPEANEHMAKWHMSGGPPAPTHSKLAAYVRSRTQHVLKLTIISAISRSSEMIIRLCDVERAIAWLLEIELLMPDIFREMIGRSDSQVLEEMHYYVQEIWIKRMRRDPKGVHGSAIVHFLSQRVPSEKIHRIMDIAERSNVIARVAGTTDNWIPKPKHDHGVE